MKFIITKIHFIIIIILVSDLTSLSQNRINEGKFLTNNFSQSCLGIWFEGKQIDDRFNYWETQYKNEAKFRRKSWHPYIYKDCGQEDSEKKHNFIFGVGIGHSKSWNDVYYKPSERITSFAHEGLLFETLYPGYNEKPIFYFNSDINYYYRVNRFLFIAGLNYVHNNKIRVCSLDSINKYYLFSDSTKLNLPYYHQTTPLLFSNKTNQILVNIAIGYKLWHFDLIFGMKYNIINYHIIEKKFIENKIYKKNYYSFFERKPLFYSRLNYYFKKDFPISAYLEIYSYLSIGFQIKIK